MDVPVEQRWESLVDRLVDEGRFGSRSDVVSEGLRLVEEREAKLASLRAMVDASIAEGGEVTDEEIDKAIEARSEELEAAGYAEKSATRNKIWHSASANCQRAADHQAQHAAVVSHAASTDERIGSGTLVLFGR